jgi:hypothetical protein
MTREQFCINIKRTYPDLVTDIIKGIDKELIGYTEEQIENLYDSFIRSPAAKYTPKSINIFIDLAVDNGIIKKSEYINFIVGKCYECGATFSKVSTGCPECKSKKIGAVQKHTTDNHFIRVKDNCWNCEKYNKLKKPQGPSCSEWGKIDNGMKKQGDICYRPVCNDCLCKECCKMAFCVSGYFDVNTIKEQKDELKEILNNFTEENPYRKALIISFGKLNEKYRTRLTTPV